MRVLVLNRFYWPDESATAMLATDLAEDLAAAGHEVHVLTSRLLYEPTRAVRLAGRETRNGVNIRRLWSTGFGRSSSWRRMSDLLSFQFSLRWRGMLARRPEAIVAMTDPPMLLGAGRWIQRWRGGRLYHHVDDVYPEIAAALGAMRRNSMLTRWLERRYRRWLAHCAKVFVLGVRMAERLEVAGATRGQVLVAPPWADGERIRPMEHGANQFRKELNLTESAILVMYSGNMGRAHTFETILAGMEALRDDERFHFLFVGGGARKGELEEAVRGRGLPRARFLPYQPRERLVETLSAADVHLVSQDRRTVGLIVPSKLAGILAAGRPALFVGPAEAEVAETLAKHGCGARVAEGETGRFVELLRDWAGDSEARARMGRAARSAFEAEYSRELAVGRIRTALESGGK